MTTWLIVLTNVHRSAVSLDGVHPPTWKGYRNREREAQLFILAELTITPYLHTFRLCEHLHIQKYSAIFPRLPTVCVCMHNNVLQGCKVVHLAAMCQRGRQQLVCLSCVWACALHVELIAAREETYVVMCNDTAIFVFDYCTRLRLW